MPRLRPEVAGRPAAQHPPGDQIVEHRLDRRGPPNSSRSSAVRCRSAAAQARCGPEDVRVGRIGDGRLHRAAEHRLGMVHQVGVQRVVPGDEHHQRPPSGVRAAARPPGLLPHRGQRAGIAGEHGRVQPGDVDAELERVGARPRPSAHRSPARVRARAAPPAGTRRGRRRPCRPAPERRRRSRRCAASAVCSAPCRDRTKVRVRAPAATRSAIIRAASAVPTGAPVRRPGPSRTRGTIAGSHSTKSAPGRGAPSSVTATHRAADQPAGRRGGLRGGRRREHEHRVRPVQPGQPDQPAQHQRDVRAEHPAVGVALVDHHVTSAGAAPGPTGCARAACRGAACPGWSAPSCACALRPVPVGHGGVAVVDGGAQPRSDPGLQRAELIGGQRLGRRQVQHAGSRIGRRAPSGRAVGRPSDLPDAVPVATTTSRPDMRQLGGLRLVRPGQRDARGDQNVAQLDGHPRRPGAGYDPAARQVAPHG